MIMLQSIINDKENNSYKYTENVLSNGLRKQKQKNSMMDVFLLLHMQP